MKKLLIMICILLAWCTPTWGEAVGNVVVGGPAASTTTPGIVELAENNEDAANVVVKGNDDRMDNARTPSTHNDSVHSVDYWTEAENTAAGYSTFTWDYAYGDLTGLSVNVMSFLGGADYAAMRTLLNVDPAGTDNSTDEDAASIEDIITGSSEDTSPQGTWKFPTVVSETLGWLTYANLVTALNALYLNQNTTGTAANVSGTPALPDGVTATTQSASDNSTKIATTAYVDTVPKTISFYLVEGSTDVTVVGKVGNYSFTVPVVLNGWDITDVGASVEVAGVTGTMTYDLEKNGTAVLSTVGSIATTALNSTSEVINGAQDAVATNDLLTFDIDAIHSGTVAKGFKPYITFTKP